MKIHCNLISFYIILKLNGGFKMKIKYILISIILFLSNVIYIKNSIETKKYNTINISQPNNNPKYYDKNKINLDDLKNYAKKLKEKIDESNVLGYMLNRKEKQKKLNPKKKCYCFPRFFKKNNKIQNKRR